MAGASNSTLASRAGSPVYGKSRGVMTLRTKNGFNWMSSMYATGPFGWIFAFYSALSRWSCYAKVLTSSHTVAHALVRAASRLVSTLASEFVSPTNKRRDESRRGTHECVRHDGDLLRAFLFGAVLCVSASAQINLSHDLFPLQ